MENKKDIIKNIFFNEIVNEAKTGEVIIEISDGDMIFNVGFNSCINGNLASGNFGDSKPILMINNTEQLITLLEQYIIECDKHDNMFSKYDFKTRVKGYLTLIWSNAIYENFANPCLFISRQLDFLKNKIFDFDKFEYSNNVEYLNNSKIIVSDERQDIRNETPYTFKIFIENGKDNFELPHINYGISNNECYIYAIQNNKGELSEYGKKINRKLYKVNEDVIDSETSEYLDYKNGSEYYPENISDVSPSAILALTIFLDMLNQYGIEKVNVITLLPIRYNSKELPFQKKYEYQLKNSKLSEIELKKLLLEYKKENLRIQRNLSEKLIRNFRRIEYHFSNCAITSYPMEFDEYLHMIVRQFKISNNPFLNDVINSKKNKFLNK